MYQVVLTENAVKFFKKADKYVARMLINWIKKNLENCTNPRLFGKQLQYEFKDRWRYRVGDYRILVQILDSKLIILVVDVNHRKSIYK